MRHTLLALLGCLLLLPAWAQESEEGQTSSRRAATYREALAQAGDDGVIVYCYGPDWNPRSVRLLKSFWQTPAAESCSGNAILVAAPLYQDPTDEQKKQSHDITAGMPRVPLGICPQVMLIDKQGVLYANLAGMDGLGKDPACTLGQKSIQENIGYLRKRNELMEKADSLNGVERARVLGEVADLPISRYLAGGFLKFRPANLPDMIEEADPADKTGMVRRNRHDARLFLREQMDTPDGFLKPDLVIDMKKMTNDCMKIIKDKAYRPEDRQRAYMLLIGQTHREEISGSRIKGLIDACMRIDPKGYYGQIMPGMAEWWGSMKFHMTAEERRAQRKKAHAKDRERRDKERNDKRAEKNTETR